MSFFASWLAELLSPRSGMGLPSIGEFVVHAVINEKETRLQANIHAGPRAVVFMFLKSLFMQNA
jgi:hypothetical protein